MIRQRGLAMIMIIVLLALVSAYLITSGINRTSTEVTIEREQDTQDALLQAKAALAAYAASQAWSTGSNDQPGSLPCPDITDDGAADTPCATAASRVGRFPWKTIGAPELRDASGEKLWYALSADFRTLSGTTIVNSDTLGQLTVVGSAPASNVVAVLIAPGSAVLDTVLLNQPQDRSAANINRRASYLEDRNAGGTTTFTTAAPGANGVYNAAASTYNSMSQSASFFSDRLLAVTHADLFSTVEPVVAARIERDIKPYIATYFRQWGAFPFPSIFANPDPGANGSVTRTQDTYVGSAAAGFSGLLPVTANATYPYAGGGSVTLTGGIADSISGVSCNDIDNPPTYGFYCTFNIRSLNSVPVCGSSTNRHCIVNPSFTVQGNIANVGMSFADMADTDVTVTSSVGGAARAMSSTTLTRALSSAGEAAVTFQGTHAYSRYNNSSFTRAMVVTFPVVASALTSSSGADTGWFIRNQWYRQVHYAVSPGYLPGGGGACTVRPAPPAAPAANSCLMVNNLPGIPYPVTNDKRAILLLMGRSLNGSARPSATLGNYLEGFNATALTSPQYVFEHRAGAAGSINDRVVVVCPDATLCP